jgi:hypothetical protein
MVKEACEQAKSLENKVLGNKLVYGVQQREEFE